MLHNVQPFFEFQHSVFTIPSDADTTWDVPRTIIEKYHTVALWKSNSEMQIKKTPTWSCFTLAKEAEMEYED